MLMFVVPYCWGGFYLRCCYFCVWGVDEQVPNEWSKSKERLLSFLQQTESSFASQNWIKPSQPIVKQPRSIHQNHSKSFKIPSTPCPQEFVTIVSSWHVSSTFFTFSHLHPSTNSLFCCRPLSNGHLRGVAVSESSRVRSMAIPKIGIPPKWMVKIMV